MRPKASNPTRSVKRPCMMSATQTHQIRIVGVNSDKPRIGIKRTYLDQEKPSPSSLTGDTSHVKKPIGEKSRENIRNTHSRPKPTQSYGELMVFVEVRKIQDDLAQCQSWSESRDDRPLTSGMNPPCSTPSSALQTRNDSRPLSQNCAAATKLQRVSCIGIHLSGPIHLETS